MKKVIGCLSHPISGSINFHYRIELGFSKLFSMVVVKI